MAGKDMLIEKSMAGNLEGAARIVRAVERHKVRLMPAFSMRFHPVALRVKALVEAGVVGSISRVRRLHGHFRLSERGGYEFHGIAHEGRWGNPVAERRDSLFYSGSHVALWFQWMFGVPQSVMCMTNTLARGLPVEDNSVVLLRYAPAPRPGMEAGFVGVMDCSETLLAQTLVAEIYGTDGVIVQRRGNLPSTRVTGPMPTPLAIFSRARNAWEYPLLPPHFLRHEPDYSCPGVFFRTLLREQPTPMDARDGYDSIALLVAAEQSVRTGHEVAVRPWPRSGGVDGTVA
jgi:predicted dehydrogenase